MMIDEWGRWVDEFFPPNPINFFVQHKRPHQTAKRGASGNHWKQAYYEFRIDAQQQSRLATLEDTLGPSGVVTYACAAFLSKSKLWEYSRAAGVIDNSNFTGAKRLTDHSRYTFVEAGHHGLANPDPTPIEDKPLLDKLAAAGERSEGVFTLQIKRAGAAVHEIMTSETSDTNDLYQTLLNFTLDDLDTGSRSDGLGKALMRILAFNTVNSTSWSVVTAPSR